MNTFNISDENISEYGNLFIISINDNKETCFFKQEHSNVIILEFDDIEPGDDGKLFTKEDAYKIIDFVELAVSNAVKNNKINDLHFIVYCEGGVSRSGAVALYINDNFHRDPLFFDRNTGLRPNTYIKSILDLY